ncbi:MAG: META domain-containing protein [Chloroflexi bacterium]|nr:META domain-containing protein [Chloroflexota bacterium]
MSLRLPRLSLVLGTAALLVATGVPVLANDGPPGSVPELVDPTSGVSLGEPVLEGTVWHLRQARLSGAFADIPAEVEATLQLVDGHASGSGGCNRWFAEYALDGTALSFGPIGSTLMFCEGPGGQVETFFFADLEGVTQWRFEDATLILAGDDGDPILAFTRQVSPALDGNWLVMSYNDGQGHMVSIDDGSATLSFADGRVGGTVGCNSFGADYTQDGWELSVGDVVSTAMACEPASIMDRETAVIEALRASVNVAEAEDGWELSDAAGTPQIILSNHHLIGPTAPPAP